MSDMPEGFVRRGTYWAQSDDGLWNIVLLRVHGENGFVVWHRRGKRQPWNLQGGGHKTTQEAADWIKKAPHGAGLKGGEESAV